MLIKPSKYHRTIDGMELVHAREGLFLTQAFFAALCGWSQPYQARLEDGESEISVETAAKIMQAVYYHEYSKVR